MENKYGFKLDGTPKKAPGRKAGGISSVNRVVYLLDGKVMGRGKPSLAALKRRTYVEIPKNVAYDAAIHGVGIRPATDDARAAAAETAIAARAAAKATPKPAAAGPSIGETAVSQDIKDPTVPVEVPAAAETETAVL